MTNNFEKLQQIYEGKAKILFATNDPNMLIQHFKDDATAFNAQKKAVIEGKGELNNSIGSKTDITERNTLLSKNIYNNSYQYSSGNPNALSDGDERGRGENNTGGVGTVTDINERTVLRAKNKYGSTKTYPDF